MIRARDIKPRKVIALDPITGLPIEGGIKVARPRSEADLPKRSGRKI